MNGTFTNGKLEMGADSYEGFVPVQDSRLVPCLQKFSNGNQWIIVCENDEYRNRCYPVEPLMLLCCSPDLALKIYQNE